jgi:hypothetical protein
MLPGLTKLVKAPPVQPVSGGFEGLLDALELLRSKKVSGKKLVVKLMIHCIRARYAFSIRHWLHF